MINHTILTKEAKKILRAIHDCDLYFLLLKLVSNDWMRVSGHVLEPVYPVQPSGPWKAFPVARLKPYSK